MGSGLGLFRNGYLSPFFCHRRLAIPLFSGVKISLCPLNELIGAPWWVGGGGGIWQEGQQTTTGLFFARQSLTPMGLEIATLKEETELKTND